MNIKSFIGHYPEICTLPKRNQIELLEQARYQAFSQMGLSKNATIYMMASIAAGFLLAMLLAMAFDFTPLAYFFGIFNGILSSSFIYRRLYQGLLQKGLTHVLQHDNT